MNNLKKALMKDDIKKYQLNPKHSTHLTMVKDKSISNRNDWTDINNFIECVIFFTYSESHIPKHYQASHTSENTFTH